MANGCQELYNYCDENTVTNIIEYGENEIVVFPNPTTGKLTIKTSLDITYILYDFTGKVLVEDSNKEEIDITTLPNGVYFLSIRYGDKIFNKRIVKED